MKIETRLRKKRATADTNYYPRAAYNPNVDYARGSENRYYGQALGEKIGMDEKRRLAKLGRALNGKRLIGNLELDSLNQSIFNSSLIKLLP